MPLRRHYCGIRYRPGTAHSARATTTLEREEPLGFVSCFVEYEIDGTVSPFVPATHEDPPEGGEVEIEDVTRIHPITGEHKLLSSNEWPFSDEEITAIEEALAETPLQDYDDDYPDYEPFDDNEADDYIP